MATIVSITEVLKRFQQLGWSSLSSSEVADFLRVNSVPSTSLISYLDALIATPSGLNDQTIAGCPAADATKITGALKAKGVEI
jgi:hypothetical protein